MTAIKNILVLTDFSENAKSAEKYANHVWRTGMGTKGEGFAIDLALGSNVFKELDAINCQVLIIPQNAEFKNLRKIAYATDLRSTDLFVVKWLNEFCEALNAELLITHVGPDLLTNQVFSLSCRVIEKMYDSKFKKLHTGVFQRRILLNLFTKLWGCRMQACRQWVTEGMGFLIISFIRAPPIKLLNIQKFQY